MKSYHTKVKITVIVLSFLKGKTVARPRTFSLFILHQFSQSIVMETQVNWL